MVAVKIPDLNTVNIVIYRPPGTKGEEFNRVLDELEKILENNNGP